MDLDELQIAVDFLGLTYLKNGDEGIKIISSKLNSHNNTFNPHEKEGRHFLVDMERKLTPDQWDEYENKMDYIWLKTKAKNSFERWLKTAPSETCFKCIMQVIETVKGKES